MEFTGRKRNLDCRGVSILKMREALWLSDLGLSRGPTVNKLCDLELDT